MASKALKKFFSVTGRILEECGKGVVSTVKKSRENHFRTEREILSHISRIASIVIAPPGSELSEETRYARAPESPPTTPAAEPAPDAEPSTAAPPPENLLNHPALIAALHDELKAGNAQSYAQLQRSLARRRDLPPVTMADVHMILMAHPEEFEELHDGTYQNRDASAATHESSNIRDISDPRRAFLENEQQRILVRLHAIRDMHDSQSERQHQLLLDYQHNIVEELKGATLQAKTPVMRQEIEAFWAERKDPAVCFPTEATIAFLRLYPPADAPLQRFATLDLDLDDNRESKAQSEELTPEDAEHDAEEESNCQAQETDADAEHDASALKLAWYSCHDLDAFQRATATEKLFFLLQSVGEPVPYRELADITTLLEISEKSLRRILNTSDTLFQSMPDDCWSTPFAAAAYARRNGIALP